MSNSSALSEIALGNTPSASSNFPDASAHPPDMLDTAATAKFLGVAESSLEVDRCRRRWRIPYHKIGRRVVYARADLVAFLATRRVGA